MKLNFNSANSKRLWTHFSLLGLSKDEAAEVLLIIHKWQEKNGEEWTIGRLKELKTWFIQHHSGNVSYTSPWFKHTKRNTPRGVFGRLFKLGSNPKKVKKVLSALMAYTAYRSKSVTEKQVRKTIGSIYSSDMFSADQRESLRVEGTRDAARISNPPSIQYRFYPAGLNTGKPGTWTEEKYISSYMAGLSVPFVSQYLERNFDAPSALGLEPRESDQAMLSPGTITVIQERGYKARVIAMPHASIQVAMYPLHQTLNQILRNLPTDCTHNQEEGARFAQKALQNGKTVYSVDLSGATDNFPRSYQVGILEGLGYSQEAYLMDALASAPWRLSSSLEKASGHQYIFYTKGQPQGLYGSFALFALSHNLLVTKLARKVGVKPDESFRILGDDIIITDENLYNEYISWLHTNKAPISWDKTLTSNRVAEFAGYVIEASEIWKPAKVPNASLDNNFTSYLKIVGLRGLNQLPSKMRKIAGKVARLPESDGGLGFNPEGSPVWLRRLDLIKTERDLKIPKYLSMQPRLLASRYMGEFQDSRYMVEWLNDQFNLFESRVHEELQKEFPLLSGLGVVTNVNELLYQLSFLKGGEDSAGVGIAQRGNTLSDQQKAFLTEFEIWQSRFHLDSTVVGSTKTNSKKPVPGRKPTNRKGPKGPSIS